LLTCLVIPSSYISSLNQQIFWIIEWTYFLVGSINGEFFFFGGGGGGVEDVLQISFILFNFESKKERKKIAIHVDPTKQKR
jgi:hypothetical protein